MQSTVINLSARGEAQSQWHRCLQNDGGAIRLITVSDDVDLLTIESRESVSAVVIDRDRFPGPTDPLLLRLRATFPSATFVLSVPWVPLDGLDVLRALNIETCIPRTYSDRQRRMALDLALTGVGTLPTTLPPPSPGGTAASEPDLATPTIDSPSTMRRGCGLTPRETDVAVWLVRGHTNHEIAMTLGLSPLVVRNHVSNVLRKVGVDSRAKAIPILQRCDEVRARLARAPTERSRVLDWLISHVEHVHYCQGTVIFRKGEPGEHLFYIQRGTVGLDEISDEMGPGEIFGDIGAFAPRHLRTCTARARTDIDLFRLDAEHVRRIFFESPEFAFYVVSVIAERVAEERGL